MQAQRVCLLLLCSTCVLCTGASRDQRALEEDLLTGLLAAQVRQSAPYWPTRLVVLCRILSNLRQDASSDEEVMEEVEEVMEEVNNMQNLQQLCGALRGRGERQLLQESLESLEENADSPLKRKSPYILRRQTGRSGKSRRPYILKRSAVY